jgi:hypothetical protein
MLADDGDRRSKLAQILNVGPSDILSDPRMCVPNWKEISSVPSPERCHTDCDF